MATQRVTVTVDEELIKAALLAVERGDADSVSAWIAGSMAQRHADEQRLRTLVTLVEEYEAVHGEITESEMADQRVRDRDAAADVRRAG